MAKATAAVAGDRPMCKVPQQTMLRSKSVFEKLAGGGNRKYLTRTDISALFSNLGLKEEAASTETMEKFFREMDGEGLGYIAFRDVLLFLARTPAVTAAISADIAREEAAAAQAEAARLHKIEAEKAAKAPLLAHAAAAHMAPDFNGPRTPSPTAEAKANNAMEEAMQEALQTKMEALAERARERLEEEAREKAEIAKQAQAERAAPSPAAAAVEAVAPQVEGSIERAGSSVEEKLEAMAAKVKAKEAEMLREKEACAAEAPARCRERWSEDSNGSASGDLDSNGIKGRFTSFQKATAQAARGVARRVSAHANVFDEPLGPRSNTGAMVATTVVVSGVAALLAVRAWYRR